MKKMLCMLISSVFIFGSVAAVAGCADSEDNQAVIQRIF